MDKRPAVIVAGGGIGGLVGGARPRATRAATSRCSNRPTGSAKSAPASRSARTPFMPWTLSASATPARAEAVYIDRLIMMDGMTGAEIAATSASTSRSAGASAIPTRSSTAPIARVAARCLQATERITLVNKRARCRLRARRTACAVIDRRPAVFEGRRRVGCDGVNSTIREQLTGGDPLRVSGHVAYRAVLDRADARRICGGTPPTLWAGPKCHLVHYPLHGWKTFNLVATFHSRARDRRRQRAGQPRGSPVVTSGTSCRKARKLLEMPNDWRRWVPGDREPIAQLDRRPRHAARRRRASASYQYFAQGACMAMEDAVCLADQFERSQGNFTRAFLAYQENRIVRAYRVVLSSRMLGRVYHAEGVERKIRNSVLGAKSPSEFYDGLQWLYGGTGLAA